MEVNFNNVNFLLSSPTGLNLDIKNLKEVLFVGRSNVGKSSLINALVNRNSLARVSSKPGHTKLLNFYDVDHKFYLVDAPGYGYSKTPHKDIVDFGEMMEKYLKSGIFLSLVVFLIDSRRDLNNDDKLLLHYLDELNKPYVFVLTKSDKLNQKERYARKKYLAENFKAIDYIFTSSTSKEGIENLKSIIVSRL